MVPTRAAGAAGAGSARAAGRAGSSLRAPHPTREVLAAGAVQVAPRLLGAVVQANGVRVRLTEVEAYGGGDDPGSHARSGPTRRNASMFAPAGSAYVYFTYGMHWCLNVTCGPVGVASAVLLRAGEVLEGREVARERRCAPSGRIPADRDLARGPARLCRALGIDGRHDGTDMLAGSAPHLELSAVPDAAQQVCSGPRVGVSGAGAGIPWRFWIPGEPTVSPYRAAAPRRRRTG